jgi:hypothetical protein
VIGHGHGIQLRIRNVPFEGIDAESECPVAYGFDGVNMEIDLFQVTLTASRDVRFGSKRSLA